MPIGVRARFASIAVAVLVTALIGAPAFAIERPEGAGDDVTAFAKPTDKPRPSHPHATPTPGPTPTPTPKPTPRITSAPDPDPTPQPAPTPRKTDLPREDAATPKPSKRPSPSDETSGAGQQPPETLLPVLIIPDDLGTSGGGASSSSARSSGPSPEMLGLATFAAAVVGLGSLWRLTRQRRRRPAAGPVATRAEAAPAAAGWTNVRLDDNEALPSWLRAIAEPERAPLARTSPIFELEPPLPNQLEPGHGHPARPAQTFGESLEPGAMRLEIAADETELLDQPADLGVVLTTLIAGDEVEIQDIDEPWVRVVTPLGSTGWLRTTSLGVGGAPRAPRPAT